MLSSKFIIIILIFLGILCIVVSISKNNQQYQQPKIIYRYIPRTFEEEQNEPVYASDIFRTMFEQPDVWMLSVGALDSHKNEQVNKYFVNQY